MRRNREPRGGPASSGWVIQAQVAAIFRMLGSKVAIEVPLGGYHVDILVTEQQSSGKEVKTAVEVKVSSAPLSQNVVRSFGLVGQDLRQRALVDRCLLVSKEGATRAAQEEAERLNVDLLTHADLSKRVSGREEELDRTTAEMLRLAAKSTVDDREAGPLPKVIFVVMPFAQEFDDVYILGIRETAEKLGFVVQRADDIEHNSGILETLLAAISRCTVVVGDTTRQNPNVFYEIGHAHALNKPTILITRAGENIPFDLRGINHIVYESIVDLREKLTRRLTAMGFGDNAAVVPM